MLRILIVEDEPTVRTLLREFLKPSHECVAVRSAEDGLALLSESSFELAITDLKLRGMTDEEFLRSARKLNPRMPVILISGGYGSDERKFLEKATFSYLLKPSASRRSKHWSGAHREVSKCS